MATVPIGRWGLRTPDGSEVPNVPLWMTRLATDLTDVAKDNQGTLAARPTSTALTPGIAGRYFTTTDEDDPAGVDRRRVYRDHGLGWDELATLPVSRRMLDPALAGELPSALLTPAQFLALPAQPDGTVVRVRLTPAGAGVLTPSVVLRLRLRKFEADGVTLNPSAYKWESDGAASPFGAEIATQQSRAVVSAFGDLPTVGPSLTADLAGEYRIIVGAWVETAAVAGTYGQIAPQIGAAVPTHAGPDVAFSGTSAAQLSEGQATRELTSRTIAAAGTVVKLVYYQPVAGTKFGNRTLSLSPHRVAGPAAL